MTSSSFNIGPLPEAFLKVAINQVSRGIVAVDPVKVQLRAELLRLHCKSASRRDAERSLGAIVYRVDWGWPGYEALLHAEGEADPDPVAMLGFLFEWAGLTAHRLHRRGQIRALLKVQMGRVIRVRVTGYFGEIVGPCGRRDGDLLASTVEVLKAMPPCKHPRCACSWTLQYP